MLVDEIKALCNENLWVLLGAAGVYVFRDSVMNLVEGVLFKLSPDFDEDDIVFLSGRPARIQRIGFRNTTFYMLDSCPRKKLIVLNERIKHLHIEKELTVSREEESRQLQKRLDALESKICGKSKKDGVNRPSEDLPE